MKNIKYLGILMILLVAHAVYGQDIINYAENDDLEGVQECIAQGVDVNIRDDFDSTALINASGNGHLKVIKYLVENDADINLQEYGFNSTALINASANGYVEIVKYLIEKGANINLRGEAGYTALMYAKENGHTEIVKLLIDAGATE